MYAGPALDPLTLLFSTAVMGFLMAAFAFGVSWAIPEHRVQLRLWAGAMTAAGGAFLLFYLRPQMPAALGYAAPNILSVLVPWFVLQAHASLVGWHVPAVVLRGAPAVATVAVLAVPLAGFPPHWGAAVVCTAVAVTSGTFAWLMGWHRTARSLPASGFLVVIGGLTAVAFAWRTVLAASGELPPIEDPGQMRQVGAVLSMLAGVVFIAAASITFLTMVHEVRHRAAVNAARLDGLTGVLTRQAFFDLGEAQLARRPEGQTLMMVDLDHFKAVNDRLGHQAGDAVLTRMARLIASGSREQDLVGRYGGEEFVLLLEDAGAPPLTAAQRLVDRAEAACLSDRAEGREDSAQAHCRLSVGVARRRPGEALDALVGRADAALYAAKTSGRGRAVFAP